VPFGPWIRDPGSGSGTGFSGSQTHIFDSLMANFWVKSTSKILYNFFTCSKIKLYNFMIFVVRKNGRTKKFPPSSFGDVVGSPIGIRDPGSRIRDG
jgi:hypothetical protein